MFFKGELRCSGLTFFVAALIAWYFKHKWLLGSVKKCRRLL